MESLVFKHDVILDLRSTRLKCVKQHNINPMDCLSEGEL